MLPSVVCVFLVVCGVLAEDNSTGDSYLVAYKDSKVLNAKISDREYNVDNAGYPDSYYKHSPDFHYGPPKPVYGPPAFPNYGPPPYYGPQEPTYGMPHAMLGILDKFKFKLDLFTLGKILLKIVIFKKIVSLIAIICLLLFIPSLKHIKGDDDLDESDELRKFHNSKTLADERLNRISAFVYEAIDKYSTDEIDSSDCNSTFCESKKILSYVDNNLPYKKLVELYTMEPQKI